MIFFYPFSIFLPDIIDGDFLALSQEEIQSQVDIYRKASLLIIRNHTFRIQIKLLGQYSADTTVLLEKQIKDNLPQWLVLRISPRDNTRISPVCVC